MLRSPSMTTAACDFFGASHQKNGAKKIRIRDLFRSAKCWVSNMAASKCSADGINGCRKTVKLRYFYIRVDVEAYVAHQMLPEAQLSRRPAESRLSTGT